MPSPELAAEYMIGMLGSFCCHNAGSLSADAVAKRLEGPAIRLLSNQIHEVAEHTGVAARSLCGRIGDVCGAVTADPQQLIDRTRGGLLAAETHPRADVTAALAGQGHAT